jgi:hypothetical protein
MSHWVKYKQSVKSLKFTDPVVFVIKGLHAYAQVSYKEWVLWMQQHLSGILSDKTLSTFYSVTFMSVHWKYICCTEFKNTMNSCLGKKLNSYAFTG